MMRYLVHRVKQALSLRRCRGCGEAEFHTHHLTRYGRWRFVDRFQVPANPTNKEGDRGE